VRPSAGLRAAGVRPRLPAPACFKIDAVAVAAAEVPEEISGACLPLRGQHRFDPPRDFCGNLLFPVSSEACASDTDKRVKSNACTYHRIDLRSLGATIARMQEELDTLSTKLAELATHVRALKDENTRLRAQSAAATAELAGLRAKVTAATQRMDALLERLPHEDESVDIKAK